jgi:hypothetical protein
MGSKQRGCGSPAVRENLSGHPRLYDIVRGASLRGVLSRYRCAEAFFNKLEARVSYARDREHGSSGAPYDEKAAPGTDMLYRLRCRPLRETANGGGFVRATRGERP